MGAARRPADRESERPGREGGLLEQSGLADPRFTGDDHDGALAGECGVEGPPQLGDLTDATDEPAFHRHRAGLYPRPREPEGKYMTVRSGQVFALRSAARRPGWTETPVASLMRL